MKNLMEDSMYACVCISLFVPIHIIMFSEFTWDALLRLQMEKY